MVDDKSEMKIKLANNLAAQFYVGDLVLADRDKKFLSPVAINHDICSLKRRVAEETVCVQILVLHVLEGFFVGWDAF